MPSKLSAETNGTTCWIMVSCQSGSVTKNNAGMVALELSSM
jgi:hypothetical protein